jgi:hypothetical protein
MQENYQETSRLRFIPTQLRNGIFVPMKGTQIVVDGLWRSLCPSVDPITLQRAVNIPFRTLFPEQTRSMSTRRLLACPHDRKRVAPRLNHTQRNLRCQSHLQSFERAEHYSQSTPGPVSKAATRESFDATLHKFSKDPRGLPDVVEALRVLVRERGEEIDASHYELLIEALGGRYGSAEALRELLEEMKRLHIPCRPAVLGSALAVCFQS